MNPADDHTRHWDEKFASRSWGRYPPEDLVRFMGRSFRGVDKAGVRVLVEPMPCIVADSWALTKVFMNLLGNAIQYGPRDKLPVIQVSCEEGDDEWVVEVRDNGIGIPDKARPRLFRRFERVSNTGGISGTGLGLHIVKEIVQGHGGAVRFDSTVGSGTAFYLHLPKAPRLARARATAVRLTQFNTPPLSDEVARRYAAVMAMQAQLPPIVYAEPLPMMPDSVTAVPTPPEKQPLPIVTAQPTAVPTDLRRGAPVCRSLALERIAQHVRNRRLRR